MRMSTGFRSAVGRACAWRTVDGDPAGSGDPTPAYYTATVRAERSHEWFTHHFTSEDTWFWAYYNQLINAGERITLTYTSTLTALASPALPPR